MTTFSLGHLRSLFTAQLVILFSVAWLSPMHRAIGDTYQVTSNIYGDSSTTGSLAWAISQANANPGTDTINISSALEINIDNAADIPGENLWIARITESVIINGNGATLVGAPKYITSGGLIGTKTHILGNPYSPQIKGSDLLYTPSRSFAQIGFYGQDNSAIDVQINDLNADGLCSFVIANDGSTVSTNGGTFRNLVNYTGFASGRPVFEGRPDATLNLNGIKIEKDYPFTPPFDQHVSYSSFFGTISGQNGNLNMQNSSIADSYGAGAINWIGGTANIVSSILKNSGGLSIIDDAKEGVLNFVNSILQMAGGDSLSQTNRIQAAHGGVANISSSTILYDAMGTSTSEGGAYDLNGMPLTATFGGIVNLNSSVVTPLNFDFQFPGKSPYLAVENGALYADSYSFVTPTIVQDSTSLKSLFHNDNIHTQGNTFELIDYGPFLGFHSLPFGAYPVAGGALVGIVPNAGNGGLNALINPIDNSEIRFDVFGNSRTFNGFRDIGAVQSVPEPSTLVIFLGSLGAFFIRKLRVVFTGAKRSQTLVA